MPRGSGWASGAATGCGAGAGTGLGICMLGSVFNSGTVFASISSATDSV